MPHAPDLVRQDAQTLSRFQAWPIFVGIYLINNRPNNMDIGAFEVVALIAIILFCWRMYLAIRLDRLRASTSLTKHVVGIYILEAFLPILRKGDTKEEHRLIQTANLLVALFYLLVLGVILVVVWQ